MAAPTLTPPPLFFQNRAEAGQRLAAALEAYRDREETIVLGIPRGGVLVASEVAQALNLPLRHSHGRHPPASGTTAVVIGTRSRKTGT